MNQEQANEAANRRDKIAILNKRDAFRIALQRIRDNGMCMSQEEIRRICVEALKE